MKHLDATRFEQQVGGNPALMVRIAQAFVGQLPGWRAEFSAASGQPDMLVGLLHKMKGSCLAITAIEAAATIALAEKVVHASGQASDTTLAGLLSLVAELEAELNELIEQHASAAP